MYLPVEVWTEIFKWLEQPAQIQNISLVNYWFYDIIYTNLAKKYGKEKHRKIMPDLRVSHVWCKAKLCDLYNINRSFPIAEVLPPEYIKPFKRVDIRHFDEQVLSFFNAIRQWFQQGFLLVVKIRLDANPINNQLIRTTDFAKFKMFAQQALLGHCFGLDSGNLRAIVETRQAIGNLLDEDFVLTIPRIQGFIFDEAFMIRWLFTPTNNGAQRIWILWTLKLEMKNRIFEEFINATVAQKFIVIFRPLRTRVATPSIEETQNQRTQESLRYYPMRLDSGRWLWDCIIRQPIGEGAPDFNEIISAFCDSMLNGLPSNDRPTICLWAPFCVAKPTTKAVKVAGGQ